MSAIPACIAWAALSAGGATAQCAAPGEEGFQPPAVQQHFRQERILAGVPRPIISEGEVSVQNDIVLWRVTTPIEIITRIAPDGVSQSVEGGAYEQLGASGGGVFTAESGLVELLRADFPALEKRYQIKRARGEGGKGWRFNLKPRSDSLAQFVDGIQVEGCTSFERVTIRQVDGDEIRVTFPGTLG